MGPVDGGRLHAARGTLSPVSAAIHASPACAAFRGSWLGALQRTLAALRLCAQGLGTAG